MASNNKSNSGNFKQDRQKASQAGKMGAQAQPTEAKRQGGQNSHHGGDSQ